MNVFEYMEKHGDAEGFVPPNGLPTDQPTMFFDYLDEDERMARLWQLRGRLERGEELFHPDEKKMILPAGDGNGASKIFFDAKGQAKDPSMFKVGQKHMPHSCSVEIKDKMKKRKTKQAAGELAKKRRRRPESQGYKPRAILNETQVAEIKGLLMEGTRNRELAKRYGCSDENISRIKNGLTWVNVNPQQKEPNE